jgi:selenium-binding protein 1
MNNIINEKKACCGPGYASPTEAIKAPSEKLLYTIAIYTGTGIQKPDYLATIDVDPDSPKLFKSYSPT